MSTDATYLQEVRLTAFKSFRDEVLRLSPLTVLIGRNGSGKSNALDAIEILARMASGEPVRDVLDGGHRDRTPVRGGAAGCAPHGLDEFSIGCTIASSTGPIEIDVTVKVSPAVEVVRREIVIDGLPQVSSADGHRLKFLEQTLLPTTQQFSGDQVAAWIRIVLALNGVFQLDPVPSLMRQYVPASNDLLRRSAENISAAVNRLRDSDGDAFQRLTGLVSGLVDHQIDRLEIIKSELDDVMLALDEHGIGRTPAREMSDGMLRFLAICTAVLSSGDGLDILPGSSSRQGYRPLLLVIEELENGLHPSQAATMLRLLKQTIAEKNTRLLVTTHNPPLLSALEGADHEGVVVSWRDRETGLSRLTPLPDVPGYAAAMAAGSLGDVVTCDLLPGPGEPERDLTEFNRLLGIG